MLDLGTLVDAIHVAGGSHLTLLRLSVPNSANRQQPRPATRVQLRVEGTFALWPSITLAQGSRVCIVLLGFWARICSCVEIRLHCGSLSSWPRDLGCVSWNTLLGVYSKFGGRVFFTSCAWREHVRFHLGPRVCKCMLR